MKKLVALVLLGFAGGVVQAGTVVFDNIDDFRAAAGALVEIDFSVLPDGSPTPDSGHIPITPDFNYTDWGVTFSSPAPDLYVLPHSTDDALLAVSKSSIRNWIEADFGPLVYAVGVTTNRSLAAYDSSGELLALALSVPGGFVGILSDEPIAVAIVDSQSNGTGLGTILFQPVPEPATLLLFGAGALRWCAERRDRRRARNVTP